ncbi:DNA primase [Saccharobesus litoralis]|uniref:DNA primase n=1 Tax=Saccharobesus litoralis TaxID=2172099 RepID=A0A2S0VRM8_9ALTE|nr:DNA primase [Saccharobesus litoralis]AWB66875.1 DNA primase [Saccharobesus litoralis]
MAGRIPRPFLDDLIARTDIVELIDSRVRLKKAGRNYQACCPFHNEKSPSFTVAPDKQFYHCFGCGAHGNVISFLMEHDRLEFVDAVEELAGMHGMEVPREQGGNPQDAHKSQQIKADWDVMQNAAVFFQQQLVQHPNSANVQAYIQGRGLDQSTVERFQIGYAPDGWDGLLKTLGRDQQSAYQLRDLGMLIENDNKRLYDRFRDRLMFPIHDRRGKCIGFGGRVFGDGTPKYLNSPETRIFHKGKELYGLYQARQNNRRLERLLVVEGYMDVVALAQAGIGYAVASLGTATTPEQIQLMLRYAPEIVCCYDGDRAGRSAAWRALENALPYLTDNVKMRFVFLPDKEDPDSLVKQIGQQAFEKLIDEATPIETFLFEELAQQANIDSLQGKAKLNELLTPILTQMPDGEVKRLLIDKLEQKTRVEKARTSNTDKLKHAKQKRALYNEKTNSKATPIRKALALLLENPKLASTLQHMTDAQILAFSQVDMAGVNLFIEVLMYCRNHPDCNAAQVLEHWRQSPNQATLAKVMAWEHHVAPENQQQVFLDIMENILVLFVKQRKEVLMNKARMNLLRQNEKQELEQLLKM